MALRLCAVRPTRSRRRGVSVLRRARVARGPGSAERAARATRAGVLFGAGAMVVVAGEASLSCSVLTYGAPGGPEWDGAPSHAAPGGRAASPCGLGPHRAPRLLRRLGGADPAWSGSFGGHHAVQRARGAGFCAACLSSSAAYEACTAVIEKNKLCARCLIGPLPGDPVDTTPIGALVQTTESTVRPNVWSCAALVLALPACAVKVAQRAVCVASSCASCGAAEHSDCQARATGGVCRDTVDSACEAALAAGAERWKPVCEGGNFDESYAKVADFFCGAGPGADAGPGDAAPE